MSTFAAIGCSSQGSGPTEGSLGGASLVGSGGHSGSEAGGATEGNGDSSQSGTASGGRSLDASTDDVGSNSGGFSAGGGGGPGAGGAAGRSGGSSNGGSFGGGGATDGVGEAAAGRSSTSDASTDRSDAGSFVLAWQDDFNDLSPTNWQLQSFTFDGNQAQFTPQNASVANGIFTMSLTPAPPGSTRPYLGVEMRSTKTMRYGKLSARMRFATGSGVVSGLVLFYTPFPNCDWNEIDIEHLGNSSNTSQLNAMVFPGTPVPNCTTSVTPTQDPLVVNLGVNAETGFHVYDVEWTPAGVSYFVDGSLLRTWTRNISLLRLPQTILLTIWASSAASWAGPLTPTSAPTSADVDWIKVYDWTG